jgi:hypothetical protein
MVTTHADLGFTVKQFSLRTGVELISDDQPENGGANQIGNGRAAFM